MLDKSCSEFIDELGSDAPVPGGGSASALAGAVGAALGTMMGELTCGKPKFAESEGDLRDLIKASRELTEEFKAAVMKDVTAFQPLSEAYKLPSGTEEERSRKQAAIQNSLKGAAEAPLELSELCVKALRILDAYSRVENRLAISDVGVGAALCKAALDGARLNVLINLRSMKDIRLKSEMEKRIDKASKEGNDLAQAVYNRVEALCR